MLEKTEHAVRVGPVVIAMAMIAREHARRRGTDLLGGFELSLGNATFEFFEPCPHPLHRLDAVPALERLAFFRVHHEHPHARLSG